MTNSYKIGKIIVNFSSSNYKDVSLFSLNSEYICLIITMQILLFSCIHDVNFKHVPYLYTVNYVRVHLTIVRNQTHNCICDRH
jgi:hypothetical protein